MQHRHWAWERISAGRHKALRRWFVQLNENQKVNVSHWSKSRWLQKAKELWYSCESDWVDSIWNGGQTKELWSKCNIPLFFLNMFVLGISLSTFNSPREVEHPSFIHGMFGVLLLVSFAIYLPSLITWTLWVCLVTRTGFFASLHVSLGWSWISKWCEHCLVACIFPSLAAKKRKSHYLVEGLFTNTHKQDIDK